MTEKPSPAPRAEILMTGVAMGESPRWHENRLWFSDWGAQEILAVDPAGNSSVRGKYQSMRSGPVCNSHRVTHFTLCPLIVIQKDRICGEDFHSSRGDAPL